MTFFRFARRSASAWLLLALARSVLAHDPYEVTTEVWIRPAALEITAVMARSTAMNLLHENQESVPFDPEKFVELKPQFEDAASSWFVVTSNGAALTATVKAELTIEQDLQLRLDYPRPSPGALRIEMPPMVKLGYGYGNVMTIHGDKGALLGQQMLTATEPAMEVPVGAPATAAASPQAAPPVATTPVEPPLEAPSGFRPGAAIAAIALVIALLIWLRRRKSGQSGQPR